MEELIATIAKNPEEEIRIALREFKGRTYIDIRTYWKSREGDPGPTKKGVTLNPEFFPELKKAVLDLETLLVSNGLLGQGAKGA
jgi:hypothetical protein